jgi:esterase/lipase superfamily enzyme
VSLSGTFDLTGFLDGYYDNDCYFHLPTHYLPHLTDPWFLDRFRRNKYVLATGWDDQCLSQNQELDRILNDKEVPHQIDVWDSPHSHDWPAWQRMAQQYL